MHDLVVHPRRPPCHWQGAWRRAPAKFRGTSTGWRHAVPDAEGGAKMLLRVSTASSKIPQQWFRVQEPRAQERQALHVTSASKTEGIFEASEDRALAQGRGRGKQLIRCISFALSINHQ